MQPLNSFQNPGKAGYILLPRTLLTTIIYENNGQMTETQAYLTMLTLANYKDSKRGRRYCRRGESVISLLQWGKIFGWSQWKTRRFFSKLEQSQIIRVDRTNHPHILTLLHYEELCANKKAHNEEKPRNQSDERFDHFWQSYHSITQTIPQDAELAHREWRRLSEQEKDMATARIGEYFMSLENVKHTRKAVNYLKHKTFNF